MAGENLSRSSGLFRLVRLQQVARRTQPSSITEAPPHSAVSIIKPGRKLHQAGNGLERCVVRFPAPAPPRK